MGDFRHILAVTGLSADPQRVVHYGLSLARKCRARLTVVHLEKRNPFELSGGEPVDTVEHDYMVYDAQAKAEMRDVLAEEGKKGVRVQELVRYGNAADEISGVVAEDGVDLVILPAQSEGRLEHRLLAGWRDRLTREMPCSILLLAPAAEDPQP